MNLGRALLLAIAVPTFVACAQPDLHGPSTDSDDAQTYLVFEDLNTAACKPPFVDGKPWGPPVHVRGYMTPGIHSVQCGDLKFKIRIRPGKTFHFKNWEPE